MKDRTHAERFLILFFITSKNQWSKSVSFPSSRGWKLGYPYFEETRFDIVLNLIHIYIKILYILVRKRSKFWSKKRLFFPKLNYLNFIIKFFIKRHIICHILNLFWPVLKKPKYFGIPKAKASFTLFCSFCYAAFILIGALVFQYFEEENEIKVCTGIKFQNLNHFLATKGLQRSLFYSN